MLEHQANTMDPYPEDDVEPAPVVPSVSITPGNGRKGQSATSITHR